MTQELPSLAISQSRPTVCDSNPQNGLTFLLPPPDLISGFPTCSLFTGSGHFSAVSQKKRAMKYKTGKNIFALLPSR